jgi:hypothetical protein
VVEELGYPNAPACESGRTGPRSNRDVDFLCIDTLFSASALASLAYHHCLVFFFSFLFHYFYLCFRHGLSIPLRMSIFLCLFNILQEKKTVTSPALTSGQIFCTFFHNFFGTIPAICVCFSSGMRSPCETSECCMFREASPPRAYVVYYSWLAPGRLA